MATPGTRPDYAPFPRAGNGEDDLPTPPDLIHPDDNPPPTHARSASPPAGQPSPAPTAQGVMARKRHPEFTAAECLVRNRADRRAWFGARSPNGARHASPGQAPSPRGASPWVGRPNKKPKAPTGRDIPGDGGRAHALTLSARGSPDPLVARWPQLALTKRSGTALVAAKPREAGLRSTRECKAPRRRVDSHTMPPPRPPPPCSTFLWPVSPSLMHVIGRSTSFEASARSCVSLPPATSSLRCLFDPE